MDARYLAGIKAGIIGGILMIALVAFNVGIGILSTWVTAPLEIFQCGAWAFEAIAFLATGVLAAALIRDAKQANGAAGVAGAIAGLCGGLTGAFMGFVALFLDNPDHGHHFWSHEMMVYDPLYDALSDVCCIPGWLAAGIVLAVIGAIVFEAVVPSGR